MSLWGTFDNATGNQKPIFANSNNKNMLASTVFGVSAEERANVSGGASLGIPHAGWNIIKKGTGPIATITITDAGSGINSSGFLTVTTTLIGANTLNANISYTMVNALNSQQSFSSNHHLNVVGSVAIVTGGIGYNTAPTVTYTGANTTLPTFSVTMGGRVGRISSETLVAAGSITGDDSADDFLLPGT